MEIRRFPNKLKLFRHAHGYSQKKVASVLGLCDAGILSRWEHGCSLPAMLYVFRLARMYHTHPHELFSDLWEGIGAEKNLLAQDNELFNPNQSFFV
jgi:transcriptional regulator with XRE-family HTH domain